VSPAALHQSPPSLAAPPPLRTRGVARGRHRKCARWRGRSGRPVAREEGPMQSGRDCRHGGRPPVEGVAVTMVARARGGGRRRCGITGGGGARHRTSPGGGGVAGREHAHAPPGRSSAPQPELHHAPPKREELRQPRGSPMGSSSPAPRQQGHGGATT
jgi:hypothetical protein